MKEYLWKTLPRILPMVLLKHVCPSLFTFLSLLSFHVCSPFRSPLVFLQTLPHSPTPLGGSARVGVCVLSPGVLYSAAQSHALHCICSGDTPTDPFEWKTLCWACNRRLLLIPLPCLVCMCVCIYMCVFSLGVLYTYTPSFPSSVRKLPLLFVLNQREQKSIDYILG